MDNEKTVPYSALESAQIRNERTIKRFIIALILAILMIFASNGIWLYAWCQYDYTSETSETVNVDGKDGVANYIGNNGDISNGENYSCNSKKANTP